MRSPSWGCLMARFIRQIFQRAFAGGLLLSAAVGAAQTFQTVQPSQTDPGITQYNSYHCVCLNTNVSSRGQLFVFLPGTGGTPSDYTNILTTAANLGFYTAGLMYPNSTTMHSLCAD